MYIFRGRGVFIDVYKTDDKIATSGETSLADIDLRRTYRAIDSVATLFCAIDEKETYLLCSSISSFFNIIVTMACLSSAVISCNILVFHYVYTERKALKQHTRISQ